MYNTFFQGGGNFLGALRSPFAPIGYGPGVKA